MVKKCLYIGVSLLIILLLQGCFLFSSSSSTTSSPTPLESSNITSLCSHSWTLKQGKNEEYIYDNRCNFIRSNIIENQVYKGGIYVTFYANNTCIEKGLWGGNGYENRRWSLKGNQLTIHGSNLSVGEEVTNSVTFIIESISNNNMQLKRKIGGRTCTSGSEFYRTFYFY